MAWLSSGASGGSRAAHAACRATSTSRTSDGCAASPRYEAEACVPGSHAPRIARHSTGRWRARLATATMWLSQRSSSSSMASVTPLPGVPGAIEVRVLHEQLVVLGRLLLHPLVPEHAGVAPVKRRQPEMRERRVGVVAAARRGAHRFLDFDEALERDRLRRQVTANTDRGGVRSLSTVLALRRAGERVAVRGGDRE